MPDTRQSKAPQPGADHHGVVGLASQPALAACDRTIGNFRLRELCNTSLVSLAFSSNEKAELARVLKERCGLDWPAVGDVSIGHLPSDARSGAARGRPDASRRQAGGDGDGYGDGDGDGRGRGRGSGSGSDSSHVLTLMALHRDQYWLSWPELTFAADRDVGGWLGETPVRLTDQSHGWAHLRLSGSDCLCVLERLCPLDLDTRRFPVGQVVRTAIEHLSVIILRESVQAFSLLTPRSSSLSLLHGVDTVARHIRIEHASKAL